MPLVHVPATHGAHVGPKVPAAHGVPVQLVEPAGEVVPEGQSAQGCHILKVTPAGPKVLAGHTLPEHEVEPPMSLKVPGGQIVHVACAGVVELPGP